MCNGMGIKIQVQLCYTVTVNCFKDTILREGE